MADDHMTPVPVPIEVTVTRLDPAPQRVPDVVRQRLTVLLAFWAGFVAAPAAWLCLGPGPDAIVNDWRSLLLPVGVGVVLGVAFALAMWSRIKQVQRLTSAVNPAVLGMLPFDLRQRVGSLLGWRGTAVLGGQMALAGLGVGLALVVGETAGAGVVLLIAVAAGTATAMVAHRLTKAAS